MRIGVLVLLLVCACGKSVPYEGRSVADLRRQLEEPNASSQAQAATGLSLHGPAALEALPGLVPLLQAEKPLVRQQAALALGAIGPEAVAAIEPLTRTLADPEWTVRRQAALSLGKIGPAAKASRAMLQRLTRSDPQGLVKKAAQEALAKIETRP